MSGYFINAENTPMSYEHAAKAIRETLEVVALVMKRPAVKTQGERCTLVAYAELQRMKKRLEHAAGLIETPHVERVGVDRPMGAPPMLLTEAPKVGKWAKLRGCHVLQLGSADYIEHDGELYSVNSDSSNEWNAAIPFGVRWIVYRDNIARGQYGTESDRVAVAEFRRVGFLLPEGE